MPPAIEPIVADTEDDEEADDDDDQEETTVAGTTSAPDPAPKGSTAPGTIAPEVRQPQRRPTKLTPIGLGTCFAVGPDGEIATAHHVIENADAIAIQFADGDFHTAKVSAYIKKTDTALLKIESSTPVFLPLVPTNALGLGEKVFTIGFPEVSVLGWEHKYTGGEVSSLSSRGDKNTLQISVPIQQGNSGGPLVTERGEAVGFVIARTNDAQTLRKTGQVLQNVAWAVRAEQLIGLIDEPAKAPKKKTRKEAIARAAKAVCKVFNLQNR